MNSRKKYQPPKPTLGDDVHLVISAALSPIAGAAELFTYLSNPPLEKRLDKWRETIAEGLRQLEANKGIDLSRLQSDENFISVFIQASAIAMRNHHAEKLSALKNAILNAALPGQPKVDFYLMFVRFVDELTPIHMKLLSFLIQEENDLRTIQAYQQMYDAFNDKYPEALTRDEYKMICGDLEIRGLIRISQDINDFEDIYHADGILLESTNDDLPRVIVTDIAKEFISFVAEGP